MWVLTNTWTHNNEFTGVCTLLALSERESGIPSTLGTGLQCTLYFLLVFIELYRSIRVMSSCRRIQPLPLQYDVGIYNIHARESCDQAIRICKENLSGLG